MNIELLVERIEDMEAKMLDEIFMHEVIEEQVKEQEKEQELKRLLEKIW